MKKHKLLLTLGTVAAVAAPIAAVVSCGSGSTKGTTTNKETTQTGNVNANVQSDETKIELTNDANLSTIDATLATYVQDNYLSTMQTVTYTVSGLAKNHSVKFIFDKASNADDAIFRKMITKFIEDTNYGFGWLTIDNIVFPAGILSNPNLPKGPTNSYAGFGSAAKDIVVQFPDLNQVPSYLNTPEWNAPAVATQKAAALVDAKTNTLQNVFNTLKHEYEHHETSAWLDDSGKTEVENLIRENVIGSNMYTATHATSTGPTDVANDLMIKYNAVSGGKLESLFGKLFGNDNAGYSVQNGYFDMSYHMGDMEFLNRAINNIELTAWDQTQVKFVYSFIDMVKYEIDSRKMFDLTTGRYTQDAHNLVKLYGKYVFGYDSDQKVRIQGNDFKAYSASKFDFIKDGTNVVKADRVVSHFFDKETVLGDKTIVNNNYAYHAKVTATDVTTLHFYEDSNGNGTFDAGVDAEITL